MDPLKEAFQKVKEDMNSLKKEIDSIKLEIIKDREKMIEICDIIKELNKKTTELFHKPQQNQPRLASTRKFIFPTPSTHTSTDKGVFKPLKPQNLSISTGNEGVSTDRQTDRQTDKKAENPPISFRKTPKNTIVEASDLLDSLDNLRKEIRLKFKKLTDQELSVFSTIYQLDEEKGSSDYKILSERLNLTESSIRDYVGRLIKKGIPIEKKRLNNKNIQLSISPNLKKIATLSTILQLRDL